MPEIIVKLGDNVVHKHFLYKDVITIGRAPDNEIAIENLAVSRKHASVRKTNGRYVLEDNNSANGTYVNGVRVTKTEILDKDVITIGKHKLHFYSQEESPAPVAAADLAQKTMLVDRAPLAPPCLRIIEGKQKDMVFDLNKVETRIGRAGDNDVRLNDWFVSKHHALIVRKGLIYLVRDLASWRHTLVNGAIIQEQPLKPGDQIQFGPKSTAVFELQDKSAMSEGSGRMPVELPRAAASELSRGAKGSERGAPMPAPSAGDPELALDRGESASVEPSEEAERTDAPQTAVWARDDVRPRAEVVEIGSNPSQESSGAAADEAEPRTSYFPQEDSYEEPLSDAVGEPEGSWSSEAAAPVASRSVEPDVEPSSEVEESRFAAFHEDVESSGTWKDDDRRPEVEPVPCAVNQSEAVEERLPDAAVNRAPAAEDEAHKVAAELSSVAGELSGADPKEVAMWMRALVNPSKVIRSQAQRKLKALTGRHYDVE